MKIPETKIMKNDFYSCERCNINSLGSRMCPCPRGGCDAEIVGELIITKEVRLLSSEEKEKINNEWKTQL